MGKKEKGDFSNANEPEEVIGQIEETDAQDVSMVDPLNQASTVEREYSKGYASDTPDVEPIPEPDIQPPNFDNIQSPLDDPDPDDGLFEEAANSAENVGGGSQPSNDYDIDDDFGFELNGETAVYLLDFIHNIFKNRYKVTEATLEKHGLDPNIIHTRIIMEGQRTTVLRLCEDINELMDSEVKISTKDKNQIKKIITHISKKHDVKMSPEGQLLVVLGKIGIETHVQLKGLQAVVFEKLNTVQPDYGNSPSTGEPPTVDDVEDSLQGKNGKNITKVEVEDVTIDEETASKIKERAGFDPAKELVEEFEEPGE